MPRGQVSSVARLAILFFSMVPLVPSCDGDGDDDSVSAEAAPGTVAHAACLTYFACGCDQHAGAFSSREVCELEVSATIQSAIDEGVQAGLTYNGTCFAEVEEFYEVLGCLSLPELLYAAEVSVAVEDAYECKLFYGSGKEGDSCAELAGSGGDNCAIDLICENGACREKRSAKLQDRGEPCGDGEQCRAGLSCVAVQLNGEQSCEALPGPGGTCLGYLDLCQPLAYCDQAEKRCAPLPGEGQPCAPTPSLLLERCDPYSVCETDTCRAAPGPGETCALKCAAGLVCNGGVCKEAEPIACLATALLGTL